MGHGVIEKVLGKLNGSKWSMEGREMIWWNSLFYIQGNWVHGGDLMAPVRTA